jgi:hypothetical protein
MNQCKTFNSLEMIQSNFKNEHKNNSSHMTEMNLDNMIILMLVAFFSLSLNNEEEKIFKDSLH